MELDESVVRGLDGARRAGWRAYYELKEAIGGLEHSEVRELQRENEWLRGVVARAGLDLNPETTEPTVYADGLFLPGSGFVRDRHSGTPATAWHPPMLTWLQQAEQPPRKPESMALRERVLRVAAAMKGSHDDES